MKSTEWFMMNTSQNHSGSSNQPDNNQVNARQRPVLTPDEIRVLKECNRESFWYRCAPAAVVCIGTTQLLVNRGIFKPHPKYGSLFKNMGAALVGYFLGKISYQDACREKIMRLENSPMAEALRRGAKGTDLMRELSQKGLNESDGADVYSSQSSSSPKILTEEYSQDIDTDSNIQYRGLDDGQRLSMENRDDKLIPHQDISRPGISYDELRKQNREMYEAQRSASEESSSSRDSSQIPSPQSIRRPAPSSTDTPKMVRRNQYGDILED